MGINTNLIVTNNLWFAESINNDDGIVYSSDDEIIEFSDDSDDEIIEFSDDEEIFPSAKQLSDEELSEIITSEVSNFLNPYIRGKITPEKENPNRPALGSFLIQKYGNLADPSKIELFALNAYIKRAVYGFHGYNYQLNILKEETITHEELLNAIKDGLSRDFPKRIIADYEIQQKINETIKMIEREKLELKYETLNIMRIKSYMQKC